MIAYNKICSAFGHSEIEITKELELKLENVFTDLILYKGVGIFYLGAKGEFDFLCVEVLKKLKRKYPFIQRVCCLSNPRLLNPLKRHGDLNDDNFDNFTYLDLEFDWWYTRLYYRNCEMINQSDYVVFYIRNTENSGAYKAYQYAKKKKKTIIML